MKTRMARLGSPVASKQDGLVHVAPAVTCAAARGWVLAAQTMRISVELCFTVFSESGKAIRPWQH